MDLCIGGGLVMELKINIDETMFKEVIEKELNAFSKEELHSIVRDCIVEALKDNETLKGLFAKPRYNVYGNLESEPTNLVFEAARTIDLSPALEDIQTIMINELKNNYSNLLQKVMLQFMVDGLFYNNNFKNNLEEAMVDILRQHTNFK